MKEPAFLFAAIWSHLVQSWPVLKYMCKAKYKTLGDRYIHYNYFSFTTTPGFLKVLFFMFVSSVLVAMCITVSLFKNRQICYY